MSATETYQLLHPFEHNGESYSELTLRRPKMRDLKKQDGTKSHMQRSMGMIADLAEISPAAVGEIDAEDFKEINKIVAVFLGASEAELQRISDPSSFS